LGDSIENIKLQLGKYQKLLLTEGADKNEVFSEASIQEHKKKMIEAKNIEAILEVLISFRVNALQISSELRSNLVHDLIRNDIFLIEETKNNNFVLELFDVPSLVQPLCALISILASKIKGVDYLLLNGSSILQRVVDILRKQENSTVIQRFCLAILQKASVKESTIEVMLKNQMINWILKLVEESVIKEVHIFSVDFAIALLANILHAGVTLEVLEKNNTLTKDIIERLLGLLKSNLAISVLMHILICLAYLSKERFSVQAEQCQLTDKISEFVEYFSQQNTLETDEVDKRTVLDLCAHIFHPKDGVADSSQSMEYNGMKFEEKIKEFENEQSELIFECFPDETNS